MRKAAEAKKKEEAPFELTPSIIYLILYNIVQALGWTALAIKIVYHFTFHKSCDGLYDEIKMLLNIFQTLAALEVVHAMVGFVRSSVSLTAFQVASRVFLTWCILHIVPETQNGFGVLLLLTAWSVTEIIRYTYYMTALVQGIPFLLQWARYTFFFVLYPVGVTGELMCIYSALPYVYQREIWSFSLPNKLNISFHYYYALIFIMLSYIPLFPQLYFHMIAQRKKVLGSSGHQKHE